jgi:beta-ureidopropionase / N-carbamoyl-L-amino-acid hydrolase
MIRREFLRDALALGCTSRPILRFPTRLEPQAPILVDGQRLNDRLARLATFGRNAEGGIDRVAYSAADLEARDYMAGLMREAGLTVHVDIAGNLVGRRLGQDATLPPILFGSHIDSVPNGGNYDGQVGSMGAVEVAETLRDQQVTTRHPLEVIVFENEEGGKTGSRALSGEVRPSELDLKTASGKTIREGIALLGGDPARLDQARREPGSITAYLELHVEQGAILDTASVDIGVVEGIVGIRRWNVTFEGFANHAGTTPMSHRRDALVAAAQFIQAVNRIARETPGRQVATVGRIAAHPGAPNVIPGRVDLSLEIRDLEMSKIESVYDAIVAEGRAIAEAAGTTVEFAEFYVSRAAPTDERIRDMVANAADRLGLSSMRLPSGAGHDAQSIALLAPVGMVFVPSRGGISHAPSEFTEPNDVTNGANVLLHTLLRVDAW